MSAGVGLRRMWGARWGGVLGVVALAAIAGPFVMSANAVGCSTSWASAMSGSWTDATKWTAGVPTSTSDACITVDGTYTVTLTGSQTVASLTLGGGSNHQTLAISTSHALGASLTLSGDSSNSATLKLTDPDPANSGSAEALVLIGDGVTLTNSGTIDSDPGAAGQGTRVIDGHNKASTLVNTSAGEVTVNQDLQIDSGQSGLFKTSGDVTIAAGQKLLVDPNGGFIGGNPPLNNAGLDIEGGTITDNGTFAQGINETGTHQGAGALTVNGGTITGGPLLVTSGSYAPYSGTGPGAAFSGAGTGTYEFVGAGGATTLGGTIGSSQKVILSASTGGGVSVQLNSDVTNDGTLELTDSDTSGTNQNADRIQIGAGDTLTNHGALISDPGPVGAGQRIIDGLSASATLANASDGTVTVNAALQLDTGQNQTTFTTAGTITVAAGQTLQADPNGGSATFNLNGGSVTNKGTLEIGINSGGGAASGTTFNINGATVTGGPIIAAGAHSIFSGSGSGSFELEGPSSTLAGTIGSQDKVSLSGTTGNAGSVSVTTSGDVLNDGTLTLTDPDSSPNTSAFAQLVIPGSSTFTNAGTMISDPGPTGSGYRSIDGTLNNSGTLDVNMLLQLALHATSGINNSGTVNIASGQAFQQGLMIGGGSGSYTQSGGTTTLAPGAALSATAVFVSGGSVTGAGTICGPGGTQTAPCGTGSTSTDLTNGATVTPSPTPSTLTIKGNYTQSSTGTLAVGVASGGNDLLALTGSGNTAALDGTLQVTTASGFTPATGSSYQLLTASSVSGTFATATGLSSGPYTVAYDPADVTLKAVAPAVTIGFNPASVTFGSLSNTVAVGSSATQTLTITDTGTAPLLLGTLLVAPSGGAFSLSSDTCSGQTVQPGSSCTVKAGYKPTAAGTDSATVSVPDNAPGSPQHLSVTGYAGAAGPRATPTAGSVDFGQVGVGVPSVRVVGLTNSGSAPLSMSAARIAGADAADFRITADGCTGQAIAAGSACAVDITLTASATGTRAATLTLSDSAPDSPQTVPLTATASSSGTLSGTVVNGAVSGDPPLAGASVDLCTYTATTNASCRSATTNAKGTYSFTGLAPGSYRMEVHPPQATLQPTSAVVEISAGPNSENFMLTRPQSIPAGVSFNGQTSGQAVSFWESPNTVQVPLDAPSKGSAGLYGVTVMDFGVEPAGGTGAQPDAHGRLEVEYRFDSSGVPRLIAINTTTENRSASIGSWTTSLSTAASVGEDVRGLTAQGVFTPPLLQIAGRTVRYIGGNTSTSAPVHGEFDYTIDHWSVFGTLAGAAKDNARPTALAAVGGGAVGGGLGGAAAGDLTNDIANPTSDPSTRPCPSQPTYSIQNGQPTLTLPNGDQWTYDNSNPVLSGSTQYGRPSWQLTTPNGVKVTITRAVLVAGAVFPGTITVQANIDGQPREWTVWEGDNPLSAVGLTSGLQTDPTSQLPPSYWPDAGGFILALNVYVDPSGDYIADMRNAYNAAGQFSPRYAIYYDGTVHDLQTGAVWNDYGGVVTPGAFRGQPCGQNGPPQPSAPPARPSPTPQPTDPNSDWSWVLHIFDYNDPSGTVVTTTHIPVAGAKVVLERSSRKRGPFKAVPKGSVVMSPSNRRNPDHTTALGGFGWDVLDGFYEVTAQHSGCTAATGGRRAKPAHTPVLVVPPPVTGLSLRLRCPHLRRTVTHTTLQAKMVPVHEVVLVVTVRGRHPVGLVMFSLHGRTVGYVPLDARKHRASLTVAAKTTRGYRATYEGDGYNAPSSGAS